MSGVTLLHTCVACLCLARKAVRHILRLRSGGAVGAYTCLQTLVGEKRVALGISSESKELHELSQDAGTTAVWRAQEWRAHFANLAASLIGSKSSSK